MLMPRTNNVSYLPPLPRKKKKNFPYPSLHFSFTLFLDAPFLFLPPPGFGMPGSVQNGDGIGIVSCG